ncbi:MAG: VWA domain-containing protein [Planctomycetes bacterium]|nr:VWA domain-containing protein [Planctomycetota bacterium]
MTRFAYPLVFLALLLLPLLWFVWQRQRNRPALRFSSLAALRAAGGARRGRLRLLLPVLRTVALVCLIVAVARPQRADESSRIFAEGIAIQMVVDTSSSMTDTDLSPSGQKGTRLDAVKEVMRRFVEGDDTLPGRSNDLIGMVRFARYADSVCPLTLDRDSLLEVLDNTHIVQLREEDGTAIGDGLALAVERLKDLKRTTGSGAQLTITGRVVILLTDGENNAGVVTPMQAGELAATYGIKVYTILAGTGQRALFGRFPANDRDLKHIAEVTGGKHFRARDRESLTSIYAEIDQLERTRVEERTYTEWGELSLPWLVAAFVCLSVQTLLDATRLRKIP